MTFTETFGKTPRAALLDFLGDHAGFDYPITEMADKAGISRTTVYNMLDELLRLGFVKPTRRLGQSQLYTINTDNLIVREVLSQDMLAARDVAEREAADGRKVVARRR
jgi:DNA-binding IclR family transcriptional regulator